MNIYLIRHTKPDVDKTICYGQTDIALPADGDAHIKQVIEKLNFIPQHIYTSPLTRCKQLAETLLEYTTDQNPSFFTDDRLMEMNFGDWEMTAWDDIPEDALNEWTEDFVNKKVPNGESFTELNTRVQSFWNDLLSKRAEDAVIVAHAGVIRAILANVIHLDLKYAFRLGIDYGGISKIEIKNPELMLVRFTNL